MKVKNIVLFGLLGALIFVLKFAMAGLPNIEPVTLLVMVYASVFNRQSWYPISIYIVLEMLIYGFGLWTIGYCYIWFILALISVAIIPKIKNRWCIATIAGLFGLLFGALYIPIYIIYGGIEYAIAWWIAGLSFDAIHAAGNFVIVLLLYKPMSQFLQTMYERY